MRGGGFQGSRLVAAKRTASALKSFPAMRPDAGKQVSVNPMAKDSPMVLYQSDDETERL